MKYHRVWVVIACLCWLGCSGKVQTNPNASQAGAAGSSVAGTAAVGAGGASGGGGGSGVGAGGAVAGAGGAGGVAGCPALEPVEGSACPRIGLSCNGYGSLSCPDVALCAVDNTWKIQCPAHPFGLDAGSCGCAHPLDDWLDAGSTRVPLQHRAAGSVCAVARPAIMPTPGSWCQSEDGGPCMGDPCNRDSDCKQGLDGRCSVEGPGPPHATCSYDECASDSDCAKGVPCQCRAASSANADACLAQSSCGVDADCGPNGYCSPSHLDQWCGGAYYCHTPLDTCVDDSDCTGTSRGCYFDVALQHWACGDGCGEPPP